MKRPGVIKKHKLFPETTMEKILEKKIQFSYETAHYAKSLIFTLQKFFASIDKILILGVWMGTRL